MLAVLASTLALGCSAEADPAPTAAAKMQSRTFLSEVYDVDKKYRSMQGPYSQQRIQLGERGDDGLFWITGYEAVMVGADGETSMPQEFMCHSNLDIDVREHHAALGGGTPFGSRLFTLSQGQFDIRFPDGFGIPVRGTEQLSLLTQVLNHNLDAPDLEVRHKVTLRFIAEKDATSEMVPLFPSAAYGLALLEGDDGYFGIANPMPEMQGPGCMPGENASEHTYEDGHGRVFTGHWVVKPGREENRTLVTRLMGLPYDTTLHYVAVHLHPYAESLELRDLTTDEVVFASEARNFEDRIGLAEVQSFSSVDGIPLYRSHEYEIRSVYHNTTDEDQDSMAVMYLYLRDLRFQKPST